MGLRYIRKCLTRTNPAQESAMRAKAWTSRPVKILGILLVSFYGVYPRLFLARVYADQLVNPPLRGKWQALPERSELFYEIAADPSEEEEMPPRSDADPRRLGSMGQIPGNVLSASATQLVVITDRDMSLYLKKGEELAFAVNSETEVQADGPIALTADTIPRDSY